MRAGDRDALFAVAADPLIWAGHPAHDRWRPEVFRAVFDEGLASGGSLVALDPATSALIGHSRYDLVRAGPGEVEIGWTFLARSHWGGATNAAMKALMLGHAFACPGIETVIFLVGETNARSRAALAKIGARLTERRHAGMTAGAPVEHLIYAIDRADWLGARPRSPIPQAQSGKSDSSA
jgi:RimJ/RimL family protein N-acetyltransferase